MKKKIFRSIFSVSVIVIICSAVVFTGVLYRYFSNEHNKEIRNEAQYISQGYNNNSIEYLDSVKQANDNTRITLISSDGTVIYDSEKDASQMENHLNREEVKEALASGSGESSRYSSTLSEKTYYYAIMLDDGNVLRVSNVRFSAMSIIWNMIQPIFAVTLIAIILSAILSSIISKKVTEPINKIDLDNPENIAVDDELTPLIKKIRSQNKKIHEQMSELQKSQQEFHMITENMSEGLIIIDSDTDIISYNKSAESIFGTTASGSAFVLNRSEAFRNAVEAALGGKHNEQNLTLGTRIYSLFANPVIIDEKVMGAVIVVLDITEKEEREALRREFTANVSHELKTPLTSISGYAEIMMNGIAKSEDIPHFSENIYKEASRLITLVGDIIKISQLDEGLVDAQKQPVDLLNIAESVALSLKSEAQGKRVSVEVDGIPCIIDGVYNIIEEMLYNIVDNAIKYNKKDGSVRITVKEKMITVADTGMGIPAADLPRVFERFYRADKSHSKEIGGTGLGLSIVKHAAAFHNASVSIESTEGVGTTVCLSF